MKDNDEFLFWTDVAKIFNCGRSKARLIMQDVGVKYAGKTPFITLTDLYNHLSTHGGEIRVAWPTR